MTLRVVSHGAGRQTTAMLVLAARGELDYRLFLFANTGDDSENPATLAYLRTVGVPYAAAHGIDILELQRHKRGGEVETLYGRLTEGSQRTIDIPVRMGGDADGAPGNRNCTKDFKLKVVARWLVEHGATAEDPAEVAVGISLDEIWRAGDGKRRMEPWERVVYPLLDLHLRRNDCDRIILSEPLPGGPEGQVAAQLRAMWDATDPAWGSPLLDPLTKGDLTASGFTRLPRPPKSACWFCPTQNRAQWRQKRRQAPGLFFAAADLEAQLIARRAALGRDAGYLTRACVPLAESVPEGPADLWDAEDDDADAACDAGSCFT